MTKGKIICNSCGGEVPDTKFKIATYHPTEVLFNTDDNDVEVTVEHADIRDCIKELGVQLVKRCHREHRP